MDVMKKRIKHWAGVIAAALLAVPAASHAVIDGVAGTEFNLTARAGNISTADGNSILAWGYAIDNGPMQYPGPTLIVNQGDTITINLSNELPINASVVFPGQEGVQASGGAPGLLTRESTGPADMVSYSFVAKTPGTYLYYSGTRPDLSVEMGLVGALIVRPGNQSQAYNHPDSAFDHEYLFLLTEMDPRIHEKVALGRLDQADTSDYFPVYWFINGRTGPDTLADAYASWLPNQPYNSMPRGRPGDKVLMRIIGAGRDMHPFHHHGNNSLLIARDGRLLQSAPGAGADLSISDYTVQVYPGATYDALFTWTGEKLGWDIYGHGPDEPVIAGEYAPDHGKPFPVVLPQLQDLTLGAWYSGSPFLGASADLPPGEGGLNLNGGLFYMWHSHTEKELTNFDIFPGGMMTMFIVEPPWVQIP